MKNRRSSVWAPDGSPVFEVGARSVKAPAAAAMKFRHVPATLAAVVLVPTMLNSTSNVEVLAVDACTVTAIEVRAVEPQKHSIEALRTVALDVAVKVPKARTRQTEPAARVWLASVTPPVVGVAVAPIAVAVVSAPA